MNAPNKIPRNIAASPGSPWNREPSRRETILLWATAAFVFMITASSLRPYAKLVWQYGDSGAYLEITHAIRTWDFSAIHVKHFWGLPYAVAALSKLTRLPDVASIVVACGIASLIAMVLAHRLWGGWIALYSFILSFEWWQRSFVGGAEPLFVALLLAAFLAIRKEKWEFAALLASLATITRPLGICLLAGIAVALTLQRKWARLAAATAIGLAIGALYVIPLKLYVHDPLATVHSYGLLEATTGPSLFGIPFKAIIVGTLRDPAPLTNLLLTCGWIALVAAGNVAMIATREFRQYAKSHVAETVFLAPYLLSVYCYNAPALARAAFPRFAIPILPFVFLALNRWLPKDRRLLWALTIVSAALAAFSAVGIQNVLGGHR